MRALVKAKAEPGIWMQELPRPEVGPNDVLVEIIKTSICGSDMHIYNWDHWAAETIPVPMQTGHEFVGRIAEIGSHVHGFELGQRVSGEGHVVCGHCRNCRAGRRHFCRNTIGIGINRPGCFADYLLIPGSNVYPIPDEVPDEVACILDPLGNATHTALSFDLVGEDVLVTGAGPIGMMAVAVARHVGARHVVVTDISDYRLAIASTMGADRALNVTRDSVAEVVGELGMTEGFDVGLEMSGNHSALHDMLAVMNHGGSVGLLGIPPDEAPIDWNLIIFRGLTLKGIYGRRMFETWHKMTMMLQTGLDITPVITHEFPAAEYEKAFEVIGTGMCGKVLLDWAAA